jgi:hypothetical protein
MSAVEELLAAIEQPLAAWLRERDKKTVAPLEEEIRSLRQSNKELRFDLENLRGVARMMHH